MEIIQDNLTEQRQVVGIFYDEVKAASTKCGASIETWTEVEGYPILCVRLRGEGENKKKIMLTAGFHAGTESAGQLAVLEFLKQNPRNYLDGVELTILPLINPTGFELGTRENSLGEEVNRGYWIDGKTEKLSREGKILKAHTDEIFEAARDGELSLHGDENVINGGFVYCHQAGEELAIKCLDILSSHFGVIDSKLLIDGQKVDNPSNIIAPGLIVDENDGDFGDWLHNLGIPIVLVTETPDKNRPLSERIAANVEIIREFCRY